MRSVTTTATAARRPLRSAPVAVVITVVITALLPLTGCSQPAEDRGPAQGGTSPTPPPLLPAPAAEPPLICSPNETRTPTVVTDERTGRRERVVSDPTRTALLIGDSQSAGVAGVSTDRTWPVLALNSLGYRVCALVLGGMGFTRAAPSGAYGDALVSGWLPPQGPIPLVVVEGGGNDAAAGTAPAAVGSAAGTLVDSLKREYPGARIVLVGTLSGSHQPEPRRSPRTATDRALQATAAAHRTGFVSVRDLLDDGDVAMLDEVHPAASGHRRLAVAVAARMRAAGIPPATRPAGDR